MEFKKNVDFSLAVIEDCDNEDNLYLSISSWPIPILNSFEILKKKEIMAVFFLTISPIFQCNTLALNKQRIN